MIMVHDEDDLGDDSELVPSESFWEAIVSMTFLNLFFLLSFFLRPLAFLFKIASSLRSLALSPLRSSISLSFSASFLFLSSPLLVRLLLL